MYWSNEHPQDLRKGELQDHTRPKLTLKKPKKPNPNPNLTQTQKTPPPPKKKKKKKIGPATQLGLN